jgi:hypothetical protein
MSQEGFPTAWRSAVVAQEKGLQQDWALELTAFSSIVQASRKRVQFREICSGCSSYN